MSPPVAVLLFGFLALAVLRVPIAFSLGISAVAAGLAAQVTPQSLALRMASSLDSFPLMAIPFFILAGDLMSAGGLARRLIALADLVVGWIRGGLAMVNVAASMFFGGVSGSSVADTSCIGSVMIPMMTEEGYDRDFSVAVTVSGSTQGLIIPPSHNAIIYSVAAGGGVSIGRLFLGGAIPGVMIGLALMAASYFIALRRRYPRRYRRITYREVARVLREGIPALVMPILIVGGIVGGWFTATEAAAVAALYSFLLTFLVYRELPLRGIVDVLKRSVITISMVMLLIATSSAFGFMLALERVPEAITTGLMEISHNPLVLLLLLNLGLLVIGTFMDMAPAILILTPILLPAVLKIGMDPVHFGIVLMLNLGIGLTTPPVGSTLFVGCAIGRIRMEQAARALLVFYPVMVAVLLVVTYVPGFTMWLPNRLMP